MRIWIVFFAIITSFLHGMDEYKILLNCKNNKEKLSPEYYVEAFLSDRQFNSLSRKFLDDSIEIVPEIENDILDIFEISNITICARAFQQNAIENLAQDLIEFLQKEITVNSLQVCQQQKLGTWKAWFVECDNQGSETSIPSDDLSDMNSMSSIEN